MTSVRALREMQPDLWTTGAKSSPRAATAGPPEHGNGTRAAGLPAGVDEQCVDDYDRRPAQRRLQGGSGVRSSLDEQYRTVRERGEHRVVGQAGRETAHVQAAGATRAADGERSCCRVNK